MIQPLPRHDFFWLMEHEIEELNVMAIPNNGENVYILDVDREYPTELHKLHLDYPFSAREDESNPKHAVSLLSDCP